MIKVLSPSKYKKVECPDCGATLQYEHSDVRHDPGNGPERDFIACPECSREIVLAAPAGQGQAKGTSVKREHPGTGIATGWTGAERPPKWGDEPDRVEWWYKDFPCLLLRNSAGEWCGYVELSRLNLEKSRADFAKRLTVHGGVTHDGALGGSTGDWIGFHATGGETMAFCQGEVDSLAEQLYAMAGLVDWDL